MEINSGFKGLTNNFPSFQSNVTQNVRTTVNYNCQQPPVTLKTFINPLNAELNPICYLLALLGVHHFLHVSRLRVKSIQINHQPDVTIFQFIILTFIYSSTCFECSPAHHQELNDCSGSLWFYLRIVVVAVLCSWSGRPDHEHSTTVTTIRR